MGSDIQPLERWKERAMMENGYSRSISYEAGSQTRVLLGTPQFRDELS